MKPQEFADGMRKAAPLLAPSDSAKLQAIVDLFASSAAATVAATLTKLRKARGFEPAIGQPSIADVLTALKPFREFVAEYGKAAFAKDLQATTAFLQTYAQVGMRPFTDDAITVLTRPVPLPPTLKEDVVQRHLRHLENMLGDAPGFAAACKELDLDPDVGTLEIAALTKHFVGKAIKTRPAALKKIWARHHSLMSSRGKSESRAGRSAG